MDSKLTPYISKPMSSNRSSQNRKKLASPIKRNFMAPQPIPEVMSQSKDYLTVGRIGFALNDSVMGSTDPKRVTNKQTITLETENTFKIDNTVEARVYPNNDYIGNHLSFQEIIKPQPNMPSHPMPERIKAFTHTAV